VYAHSLQNRCPSWQATGSRARCKHRAHAPNLRMDSLPRRCCNCLGQGNIKAAGVTHSFSPIFKFLALRIGEYRGRGVIFAVFRHRMLVVVDDEKRSLGTAARQAGITARPQFCGSGKRMTVCSPRKVTRPKCKKMIECSGVHCIRSIMVDPPPRQVHDERFPADKPQKFNIVLLRCLTA